MASSNPNDVVSGPPPKRQKMSPATSSTINTTQPDKDVKMDDRKTQLVVSDNGFQPEREAEVGILHFVNLSNPGFSGTLKQRCVLKRVCCHPLDLLSFTR
jgi:tRNA pseudouridine13 synthase